MTHEKFIELLNLYLDGALPSTEATALEREIQGNVERRRIYRQYCQMQKACSNLSERFRDEASPAAQFRRGAVVELPRRAGGEWFRSLALVASGAAAACAVFVGVHLSVSSNTTPTVVQNAPVPAAATVAASLQTVPATTTVALTNPALFNNPWAVGQLSTQRMVSFNRLAPLSTPSLLPVPELKLLPGTEDLKVELQPYGPAPSDPLRMEEIENTAFQFQR